MPKDPQIDKMRTKLQEYDPMFGTHKVQMFVGDVALIVPLKLAEELLDKMENE